jgi:hypothetical protein
MTAVSGSTPQVHETLSAKIPLALRHVFGEL